MKSRYWPEATCQVFIFIAFFFYVIGEVKHQFIKEKCILSMSVINIAMILQLIVDSYMLVFCRYGKKPMQLLPDLLEEVRIQSDFHNYALKK